MKRRIGADEGKKRITEISKKTRAKKLYHRPGLTVYGDFNRVTMGHLGSLSDGGSGKASKA